MAQPSTDYIVFTKDGKPLDAFISRIRAPSNEKKGLLYCLKTPNEDEDVVYFTETTSDRNGTRAIKGPSIRLALGKGASVDFGEHLVCDRECMQQVFKMLAEDHPWIAKEFGTAQQE